eukprot:jgi/Chlat1/6756/Chrsp50S06448
MQDCFRLLSSETTGLLCCGSCSKGCGWHHCRAFVFAVSLSGGVCIVVASGVRALERGLVVVFAALPRKSVVGQSRSSRPSHIMAHHTKRTDFLGMDLSKLRVGDWTALNLSAGWNLDKSLGREKLDATAFQLNVGYEASPQRLNIADEYLPWVVGGRLNLLEPDVTKGTVKSVTPELYTHVEYKARTRNLQPFLALGARARFPSDNDFQIQPQKYLLAGVRTDTLDGFAAYLRYADPIERNPAQIFSNDPTLEINYGYQV